ncbi:MAG TPA: DUF4010 domain-containing protein [archaeon]|nr:DUF4010 domain-containing protein [archaeon]
MELLLQIGLSVILGSLIGIEREYHKGKIGIGVRTTALIALTGTLFTYFAVEYSMPFIEAIGAIIAGGFALFIFWYRVKEQKHHIGLTTSAAIVLTYFIGAMIALGLVKEAIAISVIIFALLFSKQQLVKKIKSLTEKEIISAIEFLIIAFIIYPFIPEGEFFFVNLKQVWEIVLLVSVISFVGFLAARHLGRRKGIIIEGMLGGIISSAASTAALVNQYKKNRKIENVFVIAIMSAMVIALLRNFLLGFIISQDISILLPFVKFIIISIFFAAISFFILYKHLPKKRKMKSLNIETPFAIKPALYFGIIFLAILAASKAAIFYLGNTAILPVSLLAGLVSSAGVAASSSLLFINGSISLSFFIESIVLASIGSMLNDIIYSYALGEKKLGKKLMKYIIIWIALIVAVSFI